MFPEKPKRHTKKSRHPKVRGLLLIIMLLSVLLPVTALLRNGAFSAQVIDMLLIGFMLCCAVVILYQVIVSLLTFNKPNQPDDTSIEQS